MEPNTEQGKDVQRDVYVGIDVSKDRLDGHVRPSGEIIVAGRDAAGLEGLVETLKRLGPKLVVVEATGGYETVVASALAAAGIALSIVNPRRMRDYAKAMGRLAKTDRIDAEVIARFAEAIRPEARPIAAQEAQALGEHVARRRQVIEMITAEKNRERLVASPRIRKAIKRHLALLQEELSEIDRDIDTAIRACPAWLEDAELMTSVPGVGDKSARSFIAELPELGRLDRRKIAALVGVAPYARDSGTMKGKRTIAGGRASVRTALFMATLVACRCNPVVKAHYQKLRAAGKSAKQAITACMRKLLVILNAMLRDRRAWSPA